MTTNASFIYYREKNFGKDLNNENIQKILGLTTSRLDKNTMICGIPYSEYFEIPGAISFSLKTTYPGLIIGIGYCHPAIEQGDFQLGFYFDHTTGMPVIPGSTVKGILKSVFPKKGDTQEIIKEKLKYINKTINSSATENMQINENNWENLFEKDNIFYDAYISKVPQDGRIFAEDYITPHKDIFKNPIPIRFLKIAPNVTFTFQFKFKESCFENNQKITPEKKLELFKNILLDFGIGAKRNVGYGNLVE